MVKQDRSTILLNQHLEDWIKKPKIEFVDMPDDIRFTYQYFTEAKMNKLRSVGYMDEFLLARKKDG